MIYNPKAWGEHYHPHDLDSACRLQQAVGRGLRDLEVLIPEPGLTERYGLFRWSNSRRSVARGLARKALFNRVTVPPLQRRLAHLDRRSRLAEWTFWKVMLHHTDAGYLAQPPRRPTPVPTRPDAAAPRCRPRGRVVTAPTTLERPAPGGDHGPGGVPALLVVVVVALAAGLIGTVAAQFGSKSLYVLGGAIVVAGVLYGIRDLVGPPLRDAVDRVSPSRFRPDPELDRRPPSNVAVTAGVVVSALLAGTFAWLVAQQGLKVMLALLALVLGAVAVWLLWPLLVMLVSAPSDAPARPTPDWKLEAQAYEAEHGRRSYPRFIRFVGSTIVVFSAGIIAWLAVSQGIKGIAGLIGIIAVAAALMWVKNKSLFFTFLTICTMVAFVHKSFGPQDLELSGGAVSINVTSVDVLILLLYGIWISEGTFVDDVRAAFAATHPVAPAHRCAVPAPEPAQGGRPVPQLLRAVPHGVHVPAVLLRRGAGAHPRHGVGHPRRPRRLRRRSSSSSWSCSGRPAACSASPSSACPPSSPPAPPTPASWAGRSARSSTRSSWAR